jgi:RimJ/RimL family protein N-acetyltransferase
MWGPRTRDEVRTSLDLKINGRSISAEGDALTLAAVRKGTEELVGDFMLAWVSEEHRLGEIGYIVHPDHHGQGYATEGSRLMLQLAFEGMGLHRVIGRLETRNTASARVLEKLGMRLEAHLVENELVKGEWQSEFVYAMLDREWAQRRRDAGAGTGT